MNRWKRRCKRRLFGTISSEKARRERSVTVDADVVAA
jgi:hypothetical protein